VAAPRQPQHRVAVYLSSSEFLLVFEDAISPKRHSPSPLTGLWVEHNPSRTALLHLPRPRGAQVPYVALSALFHLRLRSPSPCFRCDLIETVHCTITHVVGQAGRAKAGQGKQDFRNWPGSSRCTDSHFGGNMSGYCGGNAGLPARDATIPVPNRRHA